MAYDYFTKGPKHIHPEDPGAIGSRNSILRKDRNEYIESQYLIDAAVDQVMNHLDTKLPPEVLEKLCVTGTLKEILGNYFNQGFQNMYNRYLVTVEDEMAKKVSTLVNDEEELAAVDGGFKNIPNLVDAISTKKTTSEQMDKSMGAIYSQLQNHLNSGVKKLEREMSQILSGQIGISAFTNDNKAYSIVKCNVTNNPHKSEWVNDVDIAINIKESDLLRPLYHYQVTTGLIFRDLLCERVMSKLDNTIEQTNTTLAKKGLPHLTETEEIAEKLKNLETYIDFEENKETSPQYEIFSKNLLDTLETITEETSLAERDRLSVKENIQSIMQHENMRSQGFDAAVNAMTYYLDTTGFGYQDIANYKNARRAVIHEYKETDVALLPDEHYTIELTYYDADQIKEQRNAFSKQYNILSKEIDKVYQVINTIIEERTEDLNIPLKFEEVAKKALSDVPSNSSTSWVNRVFSKVNHNTENEISDFVEKDTNHKDLWADLLDINTEDINQTFRQKRTFINKKINFIYTQIAVFYKLQNPKNRKIIDERLAFLEKKVKEFNRLYNPFQIQPGLVIVIHISTIKQKGVSMHGLSYIMRKFIETVTGSFQDMSVIEYDQKFKRKNV